MAFPWQLANTYMVEKPKREAMSRQLFSFVCFACVLLGCSPATNPPRPGPDQQGQGLLAGVALGAGSGAVTGFQVGAGAGPGAWVGAGLGATYGALKGFGLDLLEEDQIQLKLEERQLREAAWAQELLAEHYQRRLELHPNRDIFPADIFFDRDGSTLRRNVQPLVRQLASLTHRRMPWSRIVIAAYSTSSEQIHSTEDEGGVIKDEGGEVAVGNSYAARQSEARAAELAREFIRAGIEPRRVLTQAITVPSPILIDPLDSPDRYRQAIEIIPLDY